MMRTSKIAGGNCRPGETPFKPIKPKESSEALKDMMGLNGVYVLNRSYVNELKGRLMASLMKFFSKKKKPKAEVPIEAPEKTNEEMR